MNTNGFVLLHRNIFEWNRFDDVYAFKLFLCLIMLANIKDGQYKGQELKRGELTTSVKQLSLATKLSETSVKNSLKKLVESGEIKEEVSPNKFRKITIINYSKYQTISSRKYNKKTNKKANSETNNKTTIKINNKESNPKGLLSGKGEPVSPRAHEGRGLTSEKINIDDVREWCKRECGEVKKEAEDFYYSFVDSKTAFPDDWKDMFVKFLCADDSRRSEFYKKMTNGSYRQKFGQMNYERE